MQGLALGQNTITFSTYEADQELASRTRIYGDMCLNIDRSNMLYVGSVFGSMLATNTREQMADRFPWYGARINAAMRYIGTPYQLRSRRAHEFYYKPRGHAPSLQNQANARALELASAAGQQFVDEIDLHLDFDKKLYYGSQLSSSAIVVSVGYLKPWAIPTEDLIAELDRKVPFKQIHRGPVGHGIFRLSAAAICAHFLATIPAETRSQFRRIVLNEDLPSETSPECHARGLIPFCAENPLLRVERRVSIWHCVLHGSVYDSQPPVDHFSAQVALWIIEAQDLASLGMPHGSFSLLLDGDPTPEHPAHLFQTILHRDIAWQQAIEAWQVLKPQRRPIEWHLAYDDLPAVMRDITSEKSIIRCNFDPGYPVDFQSIVDEHRESTRHEFKKAHRNRMSQCRLYETVPPLPDFRTLSNQVRRRGPCPPMTQDDIEYAARERERFDAQWVEDSDWADASIGN
ncbi:hypothetical protein F5X68DRAFT_216090 [Plectosphaerella plurivora]|uniref:Uncharacterized protein n=1 Tax=Plectosphaerella plurivora TaxID=936078 RepID=A0A9P8V2Q1_9PEZI|nr:hypothetical protein F5X68DRAFT_216090 [Plectosphaerella plurivora]